MGTVLAIHRRLKEAPWQAHRLIGALLEQRLCSYVCRTMRRRSWIDGLTPRASPRLTTRARASSVLSRSASLAGTPLSSGKACP